MIFSKECFSIFPISNKKVSYLPVNKTYSGNARSIYEKWIQTDPSLVHIWYLKNQSDMKEGHKSKVVKNGLLMLFHLMTSKYWIKEAEFEKYPIIPRKETIVIQLWHASGAFKKFGKDMFDGKLESHNARYKESKYWDLLLCSSENVVDIYANAFGVSKNKIFVSGLPRNDIIIDNKGKMNEIKNKLGIDSQKKLILYAPTFRDVKGEEKIFSEIINYLSKNLPDDYILAYKLHRRSANKIRSLNTEESRDFSNYNELELLLCATDILITDYSSIIFDYALLERPIIFYAPDYELYTQYRGFYFDYKNFVPGLIYTTPKDLLDGILKYNVDEWMEKIREFKHSFQKYEDNKNSERVIEKIKSIRK